MISDVLTGLWESSGFSALFVDGAFLWQNLVMILVSFVLLYFAIAKKCEPLLLLLSSPNFMFRVLFRQEV